eukprot:CAMPEP_0180538566 /NCGR_PEP_ID=MMETSP1036_2-20121128/66419_1 /TAXON_ID=632150 /ORGANISM="Azadinium spinosum, Strain 3D9" /LENGTH=61 /DNA_ID=CAMNT_0022553239 /DNA_START=99 /DNA_END=281 /DNA_ORIENTATION=+
MKKGIITGNHVFQLFSEPRMLTERSVDFAFGAYAQNTAAPSGMQATMYQYKHTTGNPTDVK